MASTASTATKRATVLLILAFPFRSMRSLETQSYFDLSYGGLAVRPACNEHAAFDLDRTLTTLD